LINNPKLQQVITQMLANNRDLRAAVANVVAARAQYRADRAGIFPTIGATASGSRTGGSSAANAISGYNAVNIGISSFEIDLWGRLRNQASAGFETYLSTQSGMRSTKLSLVQETALAYVTLASDEDLLAIAKDTATSAKRSLDLTQSLLDAGLGNAVDVETARTVLATAQSDMASATTQVAQDRNALDLLVGGHVDEALLPTSLSDVDGSIALVPAGLLAGAAPAPRCGGGRAYAQGRQFQHWRCPRGLLPDDQPDGDGRLCQHGAGPSVPIGLEGLDGAAHRLAAADRGHALCRSGQGQGDARRQCRPV
jgi:multidrug efflux system outer membrane protein